MAGRIATFCAPTAIAQRASLFAIVSLLLVGPARTAPITFNSALPVSQNEFVAQAGLVDMRASDGAGVAFGATDYLFVLGYGINGKLALFGTVPYERKYLDVTTSGQAVRRQASGLGDLAMLTRYTAYEKNAQAKTFRLAALLGTTAPTGATTERDSHGVLPSLLQPGLGAWSGETGAVVTHQTLHYELDTQLLYSVHGTARAFHMGNQADLDVSLQYRLLSTAPKVGTPAFVYGVLEANLVTQDEDRLGGAGDPNSGGTKLFLDPGLQYVAARWLAQLAVQLPVSQQLNGAAMRSRSALQAALRFNF